MTRKERRNPALLDGSRRRRIAAGAGVQVQDVNKLMKQFMEMQKMMKSMAGRAHEAHAAGLQGRGAPGVPRPVGGRKSRSAPLWSTPLRRRFPLWPQAWE